MVVGVQQLPQPGDVPLRLPMPFENLDDFWNASLPVLMLRFSELVEVFAEILKFTLFSKEI